MIFEGSWGALGDHEGLLGGSWGSWGDLGCILGASWGILKGVFLGGFRHEGCSSSNGQ